MKIAIIGSGIAGMGISYILNQNHEITLFEKESRIGGHSRTLEIDYFDKKIAVDTGFIVFNYKNYPHLSALFKRLGVDVQESNMSFGISINDGWLEWSAQDIFTLFGQKRNFLRPQFYGMIRDILKFFKAAKSLDLSSEMTLGELLKKMKMGQWFQEYFILPMGGAIWSCSSQTMLDFPAQTFIKFFNNHGLLSITDQPQWHTVKGGSQEYVKKLCAGFGDKIIVDSEIIAVTRQNNKVQITDKNNVTREFDKAVFACHANQSLRIIKDLSAKEESVLRDFKYQKNVAYLHRDESLMPKRKSCYASWVYMQNNQQNSDSVSVSYWMNNLQNIDKNYPLFVTLNPPTQPAKDKVFDEHIFYHPIFDKGAIAAQAELPSIQGLGNIFYCGAYQRYGFHEDGLLSAVNVAKIMGENIPWL